VTGNLARETPGVGAHASLGDRALGQLVDGLIVLGLFFFFGMLLAGRFGGLTTQGFELTGLPALILLGILFVVMLGYFSVAEVLFGMTLGKVVAEIQVTTSDGRRIGVRASLVRNLLRLVDGIGGYLVAAFSVILTDRRLRLGDLAAGTVVTRREGGRAARVGALVAALVVAIGGVAGGFALKGTSAAPGTARAGASLTATLARSVTDDHQPVDPATTFSPEAPAINAAFKVTSAPAGSRLKAVWTAINVGDAAPPNTEVDESVLILTGPAPGTFRLRRGPRPWPVGDYRLDIYLNDELVVTLPYKVAP
jgi:uncharacterized RDD family membrane protein YckC